MKALDEPIRKVHQKYWDDEEQAARGKEVLLVEGDDDRDVIQEILPRSWDRRLRIVVAGGRANVLKRMGKDSTFPTAFGFVDRDVWTDAEVEEHRLNNPRLYVTRGWCIENLFFERGFLQQIDPPIVDRVLAEKERWLEAGAFWWALQRTREAYNQWQEALKWTYGKPRDDLLIDSAQSIVASLSEKIPDSIRQRSRLDLDAVAESTMRRLEYIHAQPDALQWQMGVHGKAAFNELLVPALPTLDKNDSWRKKLARMPALGRPAPFDELFARLLA
jgi:hypothetical protein